MPQDTAKTKAVTITEKNPHNLVLPSVKGWLLSIIWHPF